jgi:hypothetical protein
MMMKLRLSNTTTTDDDFYKSVLKCLGAEPTKSNMLFMYAWRQAEGGKAKNNPFNTTFKMPGATSYNSVGVKNYETPEKGIEATCKTLKNGRDKYGYDKIIDGLKNDVGLSQLSDAVINSKWGTKDLLRKVSQGYIAGNSPKPRPINKTSILLKTTKPTSVGFFIVIKLIKHNLICIPQTHPMPMVSGTQLTYPSR